VSIIGDNLSVACFNLRLNLPLCFYINLTFSTIVALYFQLICQKIIALLNSTDTFFLSVGFENLTEVGVEALLRSESMSNIASCVDAENWSILHWAVGQNSLNIVNLLLGWDPDFDFRHINEKTSSGQTAMEMVIETVDNRIPMIETIATYPRFQLPNSVYNLVDLELNQSRSCPLFDKNLLQTLIKVCLRHSDQSNQLVASFTIDDYLNYLQLQNLDMSFFSRRTCGRGKKVNYPIVDKILKKDSAEQVDLKETILIYNPNDKKPLCWLSNAIVDGVNSTVELLLKRQDIIKCFKEPHAAIFIAAIVNNATAAEMVLKALINNAGDKNVEHQNTENVATKFEQIAKNVLEYRTENGKNAIDVAKEKGHNDVINVIEKYQVMIEIAEKCTDFDEVQQLIKKFVKLDSNSPRGNGSETDDSHTDRTTCEICCDRKKDHSLTCGHLFCRECIDEFSTRPANERRCPTCRKTFKRDEAHKVFL